MTVLMGSRKNESPESIIVGEEPTQCTHCGHGTSLVDTRLDGTRREDCNHCGQQFDVEDAIEVDEESFQCERCGDGGAIDDAIERPDGLICSTCAGKEPQGDYPDFGCF